MVLDVLDRSFLLKNRMECISAVAASVILWEYLRPDVQTESLVSKCRRAWSVYRLEYREIMSSNASFSPETFKEVETSGLLRRLQRNLAIQDWIALAFHIYLATRIFLAPDGPEAEIGRFWQAILLLMVTSTVVLVRGDLLPAGWFRALIYRVVMFAGVAGSYFALKWILPGLAPALLDMELMAIDIALFGFTPAVWMTQWNTYEVTEWLSFFYWSYFFILGLMTLPWLFLARGKMLVELMLGATIVCCLGHSLYTLVPGVGPYAAIEFSEPLNGGVFLAMVMGTVESAGAVLDIFPSLHTAYPTFFALWAFSNRKHRIVKWVWPVLVFFSLNIVVSTMFLRWHWAIDVVAGLMLSTFAWRFSIYAANFEMLKGVDGDIRQPVWEKLGLGEWATGR